MLRFEDLLYGKALTHQGVLEPLVVRELLIAVDAGGGGLLDCAIERGVLEPGEERLGAVEALCERYCFLLSEGLLVELVRRRGVVPEEALEKLLSYHRREKIRGSFLEILAESEYLGEEEQAELLEHHGCWLEQRKGWIVEEYRNRDFEGLGRSLTRDDSEASTVHVRTKTGRFEKREVLAVANKRTMALRVPKLDESGDPNIGLKIKDRLLIQSRIGQGNMGRVYLAMDVESGEPFAVKLLLDEKRHEGAIKRFQVEILATSFFDHENVVQIFDAGRLDDGRFYMVIEYVRGEPLAGVIDEHGRLAPRFAFQIFEQVLAGIGAAHRAEVVHRDLKPENLIVADRGGQPFVKIMDFGLARVLDGVVLEEHLELDEAVKIRGTPPYIAPECISGDPVDGRADLYAMGVLLFQMLTAEFPITGPSAREFLAGHLHREPRLLKEVVPTLPFPDSLQELLDRLLAKDPEERFESCEATRSFFVERVIPDFEAVVRG